MPRISRAHVFGIGLFQTILSGFRLYLLGESGECEIPDCKARLDKYMALESPIHCRHPVNGIRPDNLMHLS